MSRHRIVRNLDLDDELDDDYGEDGYDEEDDYNEDEYTYDRNAAQVHSYFTSDDAYPVKAQSPAQAVNLLDEVAKVVGSEFRKEQIAEALKAQGNDVEMAINVLLDQGPRSGPPPGLVAPPPGLRPVAAAAAKPTTGVQPRGGTLTIAQGEEDGLEFHTVYPVIIPRVKVAIESSSFKSSDRIPTVKAENRSEPNASTSKVQTPKAVESDAVTSVNALANLGNSIASSLTSSTILESAKGWVPPASSPMLPLSKALSAAAGEAKSLLNTSFPNKTSPASSSLASLLAGPVQPTVFSKEPSAPYMPFGKINAGIDVHRGGHGQQQTQDLPSPILRGLSSLQIQPLGSPLGSSLAPNASKLSLSGLVQSGSGSLLGNPGTAASKLSLSSLFENKGNLSMGTAKSTESKTQDPAGLANFNASHLGNLGKGIIGTLPSVQKSLPSTAMSGADAIKTALAALGSPAAPKVSWSGTFNGLVAPNNQVGALQREPRSVTSFAVPMVPVSNPLAPQSTSATKTSILPRGPTHSIFTSVPGTNNATLAPLTAAPSTFAEFFTTEALPALTDLRTDLVVSVSSSVPLATGENVQPFRFDSPSPDDVVAKARLQSTQAKSHSSKTILTKPPSVKTVPPPNQKPTVEESDPRDQLQSDMSSLGFASESRPRLRPPPDISRSASTPAKGSSLQVPSMAKTSSTNSVKSSPKMKRINITDEYKRRNADKETLNLVVVGHVDAGKSTLMGHLLYLLGEVSDRSMKKFERDAEKMKKGSFAYAWVLDETEEERSRGVTIDVAITKFQTEHRKFTLLDAPGHRDFVPNMMSGASQADVAILVVDATPGEFETGFDFGGQTREHAVLIRSLGVQQLIVAINKLDVVDWNKARFDAISAKLTTFLTQVGFRKQKLWFVPTSGFTGENLLKRTAAGLNAWYSGPTLVSQIDAFDPPERPIDKPFRLSISDYFKGGIAAGGGGGAVSVSGRIEGGSVQIGESVLVLPINEVGMVKALEVAEESVKWAAAGDNVLLSLSGVDITHINIGSILCDPSSPVPITTHFLAQIVTFDIEIPLTIGVPVVLHHQSLTEQATITRLRALLNRTTNEVIKKNPRALPRNVTALVEIKTTRPVCLDLFRNSKELGRFLLRSGMVTVAGGVVMEILAYEKAGSGSEDVI